MTSSDCLSKSNLQSHLSTKSRLNLSVSSANNITTDELKKTSSNTSTPTSSSPNSFYTPPLHHQIRFPQPNMFTFPRPPQPSAPILSRRSIEFKPPEQDVLDKNFFRTFNMEQKDDEINDNTTNQGITLRFRKKKINY
jgi:hypothetical protein